MKTLIIIAALVAGSAPAAAPDVGPILGATPLEEWLLIGEAQVQGECGPGRKCTAKTFFASATSSAGGAYCFTDGTYSYAWTPYTTGVAGLQVYTGTRCAALAYATPSWNVYAVSGYIGTGTSGWYISSHAGYVASLAFASLPTCNAGSNGRLAFDSTSNAWRFCRNGSGWLPVGPALLVDEVTTYVPNLTAMLNVPAAQLTGPRQLFGAGGASSYWGVVSIRLASCTTLVAAAGAGDAVYTVYNLTDAAATTATVTVPCTAAAGTVTSGSVDSTVSFTTSTKQLELRLTTNGCTTVPPAVNCTWGYAVTPTGS